MEALVNFKEIIENIQARVDAGELYFCFLHDLGLDQIGEICNLISEMSKTDDTVLDVEPDDVLEKRLVALLFDEEKLVAFVTLMAPFENELGMRLGEVGTMFTLPEYQKQGFATYLVHKIDEEAARSEDIDGTYAFLNGKSDMPFVLCGYSAMMKNGFTDDEVLVADFLPHQAEDLCRTICKNELLLYRDKVEAGMDPDPEMEEKILAYFKDREQEFLNKFSEISQKYFEEWYNGDRSEKQWHILLGSDSISRRHMAIYSENSFNRLLCCNLVVGKIF
ncbi:MAG: GNAT family N-acetyltransferase [bacterium]|nr:GNAT family N-acetyltransferase [bacterium]